MAERFDRQRILSRIYYVGPDKPWLSWRLRADRNVSHSGGPLQARAFSIAYFPDERRFTVGCRRRVSKRHKRVPVTVSDGMRRHLISLLPPEVIAECTAASLTTRTP